MRPSTSVAPCDLALAKEFVHGLAEEEDCRKAGDERRKAALFTSRWDGANRCHLVVHPSTPLLTQRNLS